jgi:hypothetical protein
VRFKWHAISYDTHITCVSLIFYVGLLGTGGGIAFRGKHTMAHRTAFEYILFVSSVIHLA